MNAFSKGGHTLSENQGLLQSDHALYPPLLTEALKRTQTLYYRGSLEVLSSDRLLAVVGSRTLSTSNEHIVRTLLGPIKNQSLCVVSGLARGIDTHAHTIAIENQLPTIAVLGSSVVPEEIYPAANRHLAEAIVASGGLLISPFPKGTPIRPYNFPARNYIMAGLSHAALVVSAGATSGSLITARAALESNRDVLTVPGAIDDPFFHGNLKLLSEGAHPISSAQELNDFFSLAPLTTKRYSVDDPVGQRILDELQKKPITPESISRITQISITHVNRHLSSFELQNWIMLLPDGRIQLK